MKRSPLKHGKPLQRKTPMSSSSTKTLAAGAGLLRVHAVQAKARARTPKARKPMKSTRPKPTRIRQSANGQECTLRFPEVCNGNPETTVWCHSNRLADGKGMGLKARDEEGCYGCSACHAWLDGGYAASGQVPREVIDARFDAARAKSQEILKSKGLLPARAAAEQITEN